VINIGGASFQSTLSHVDKNAFKHYAIDLFGSWEALLAENLKLDDYYIELKVSEGSTHAEAIVYLTSIGEYLFGASALYLTLHHTVHAIIKDVNLASTGFTKLADNRGKAKVLSTRRGTGEPGKVVKIYEGVAGGELTAMDASIAAARHLSDTPQDFERLKDRFLLEFEDVRRYPEQLVLIPEGEEKRDVEPIAQRQRPRRKKSSNRDAPVSRPHYSFAIGKSSNDKSPKVDDTSK
jgi:hypothetical protein